MRRDTKTWDIRCPAALIRFFPERRGYWFKVSRKQAKDLVRILARAYRVRAPKIAGETPRTKDSYDNGWYVPSERAIYIWPRAHVKTVFHEFYHHLDAVTGKYDSNDAPRPQLIFGRKVATPPSYGWQFAEKLFDVLRTFRPDMKPTKDPAKEFLDMAKKIQEIAHAKRLSAAEEAAAKKELMAIVKGNAANVVGKKAVVAGMKATLEGLAERSKGLAAGMKGKKPGKESPPEKRTPSSLAPIAEAILGKKKAPPPKAGGKERKITFVKKENPRSKDTKGWKTYNLYKVGMTESQFREACKTHGGDPGYLKPDERSGNVKWE